MVLGPTCNGALPAVRESLESPTHQREVLLKKKLAVLATSVLIVLGTTGSALAQSGHSDERRSGDDQGHHRVQEQSGHHREHAAHHAEAGDDHGRRHGGHGADD
ncbi:hypothetical protein BH10ACT10_BH10ACT10_15490 [soil metagenome]